MRTATTVIRTVTIVLRTKFAVAVEVALKEKLKIYLVSYGVVLHNVRIHHGEIKR